MSRPSDDGLARGSDPGRLRPAGGAPGVAGRLYHRTLTLAGGFVLAVAATLAVFLTDDRQYLRVAVVAVAWAFVLAAFAASRRGVDRATAAAREAQLRHAYELELEREVAARQEYELELEHELRRETEDAVRHELDALREEIASLSRLRDEVARVSDLRHDIAGLAALRDDVAQVVGLREDVAALTSLRQDLGQLSELRADLTRLRAELTEQLSSEMLIERIVMRTQGGTRFDPPARRDVEPLEGPARWSETAPPRELTGGWPAIGPDEPRETRAAEPVHVDRPVHARDTPPAAKWSSGPGTSTFSFPPPPAPPLPPPPVPPSHVPPPPAPQSPATEARPTAFRPSPHPRPRPTPPPPSVRLQADLAPVRRGVDPDPSTSERPLLPDGPSTVAGHQAPVDGGGAPAGAGQDGRLGEILAENGVSPSTGGRRRRRYREDGEPDDVLARVLGLR